MYFDLPKYYGMKINLIKKNIYIYIVNTVDTEQKIKLKYEEFLHLFFFFFFPTDVSEGNSKGHFIQVSQARMRLYQTAVSSERSSTYIKYCRSCIFSETRKRSFNVFVLTDWNPFSLLFPVLKIKLGGFPLL